MFGKFLPINTDFYHDFNQHAALVSLSAKEFVKMVSSKGNYEEYARRIEGYEKDADDVLRHCVQFLHKTFITPFERDDIYQLISNLDDIIDFIEDIASRLVLYQIQSVPENFVKMASVLEKATDELQHLVNALHNLDQSELLRQHLTLIRKLEHDADDILRQSLSTLFSEEKDPIAIIKWKELYELLESAVDSCEHAANTIEGVMIEQS